jgi:hypothetical protein
MLLLDTRCEPYGKVNRDARCHVHWDMNEFHEVADEAHDSEPNGDRPANVQVLWKSNHVRNSLCLRSKAFDLFVWVLCTVSRTADHGM